MNKLTLLCNKIIELSFYSLFFLVPLVFTDKTYELFEFNKMMLVYFLTVIIVAAWLIKMVETKNLYFRRTFLDIPILFFLFANIASTTFSIDPHVSFWGYYSRFNGGLLSTISYLLLFYSFVSNVTKLSKVFKMVAISLASSIIVSLWGIVSHFGIDPSCFLINHEIGVSCWQGEFNPTIRIFSTLGQFNWLAAFLAMILPIFITLILNSNSRLTKFGYTLVVIVSYLAFDLTYSRGGTIGLLAGLAVFFLFIRLKNIISNWRWLAAILAAVLLINVFFSNAFLARPVKIEQLNTDGTGIENTDSGQNRLVVWQGALEIAKHYPVFGSGVETFAYSYYQFRPKEHNLLSEWDVLFNKAHNEFLNYLATTGIVGFLSYLLLIFSFCWITIKYLIRDSSESLFKHLSNVAKLSPKPKHNSLKVPQQESNTQRLLVIALLSGYVSYHIQNIFGFSVVPIALFFYLFPAFVIIILEYKKDQNFQQQVSLNFLKKLPIPLSITKISIEAVIVIATIYFLASITTLWQADVYFAKGSRQQDYASLKKAADLNPDEPLYRSELSYLAAVMVSTQKNEVQKSNFIKEAEVEGEKAIQMSPLNVNYWKNLMRIYYELSKSNILYLNKAVEATVRAVELAPTDARLHFNLAWLYEETKQIDKAIKTQEETIYLKPDYKEAYFALASLYEKQQNKDKAISLLQKLTKFFPDDNEISGKIKSLKEHK